MGKIIELDEALANQIAAGEVVERPASVVKELVENSIDAGASRIVVKIQESGLRLIEVIDNGVGIEKEDVAKALKRHATSKIKDKADLFKIRTLGFRGEAMPSIASVSEFSIETSVLEEESGTHLVSHGGKIDTLEPVAKREGTKVTVENLFYNTPARLKYIRSLQAELSHITDVINRQSMAHPEVSFTLINEGRELMKTAGNGDLRQVIASVYGLPTAKKMLKVEAEDLDFTVSGYVSLPELTRANRNYITLMINGRFIKNFLLNRAIIEGFGNRLMVGRFPIVVLSIGIDPQLADVNVHPTKQEVRLSKERELMSLITEAIQKVFVEETLIPDALENLSSRLVKAEGQEEKQPQVKASNLYYDKVKQDFFVHTHQVREEQPLPEIEPVIQAQEAVVQPAPTIFDGFKEDKKREVPKEVEEKHAFPDLEYLAQLHATYLLCQAEDGLYIIDQHAAQERIKYEYWRDKIGEVSMDQQILLAPYIFSLPKNDFLMLLDRKTVLEEAGIYLEEYGENQLILREHPTWLQESDLEDTVYEMIDEILLTKEFSVKKYRHDLATMVACKSSIKANHPLDGASARALIAELATCENPYSCAHGRPTIVHFNSGDMEKMFRRRQETHLSKAASWKNLN
ncbi:DNA mismatch repair endonuclease MutL [Lactococcus garvieae]|uniref:DNA mismatch repair endonuclease MutL n=1 Tax=Lactococcus garvieae TaxID=1363 RepID=UPI0018D9E608|nr:DNA mismatch repair endonuclease MutL [Lactococcus garvieae]QPS70767.1 DNA mismatch repair endonuclease MutL [Lactococcus garvieae]